MLYTVKQVADELEIAYSTFYGWQRIFNAVPHPNIIKGKRRYYDDEGLAAVRKAVKNGCVIHDPKKRFKFQ